MKQFLLKFYPLNFSKWSLLVVDTIISVFSFIFAYSIVNNLGFSTTYFLDLLIPLLVMVVLRFSSFLLARTYTGILRFSSTEDAVRIFFAVLSSSLAFFIFDKFFNFNDDGPIGKGAVVVADTFVCIVGMTSIRVAAKILHRQFMQGSSEKHTSVLIMGAGELGMLTKRSINNDINANQNVVAFIDEHPRLVGKSIEGVPIYHPRKDWTKIIKKHKPDVLIIAARSLPPVKRNFLVEQCLADGILVKIVPAVNTWINGELSAQQIRNVRIEELLEREPINLKNEQIQRELEGKVILVTGAAGSIGSEITRQCLLYNPRLVILLDQAESPLHELGLSLAKYSNFKIAVGDVSNAARMQTIFETFHPELVFHAAAYKHVPLMEENPLEAVTTNVAGTRNLADLSVAHGVKKFVFVSTDKAVNPTNVMGASKRIAEKYVQSLNRKLEAEGELLTTRFITTRFGNVLGSNGSVIPLFKRQIANGGPITVTHPEITRYFMTIPEACQLVLEAGIMGRGGEIFIFDMGESVRIVDLAKKMIKLSGLQLGKDIDITYTGLRPGEKLREELLADKENTVGTHHPKIMIAKLVQSDYDQVNAQIELMVNNIYENSTHHLVMNMKELVPEFVSNNSIYEELDVKPTI